MDNIDSRLRTARLATGLTQQDLADLVGVDRTAINHYENGRRRPGEVRRRKIAAELGVSSSAEIFGWR